MDSVKFHIGDTVCLKVDEEHEPGIVTGILFRPSWVIYYVSWGSRQETIHYDIELELHENFSSK